MQQITEIAWITKTKARLYLDGECCCVITKKDVIDYGFKEDMYIEDEDFESFYHDVMEKRAKQKALTLLNGKDYSEHELYSKLERDFLSAALAKCAVDYVKGFHYIDDERFARNFVTYQSQGLSRQQMIMKLKNKGISDFLIEDILDDVEKDDKVLIRKLVNAKYKDYPNYPIEKKQKAIQALLRKGFKYGDIKAVFSELS